MEDYLFHDCFTARLGFNQKRCKARKVSNAGWSSLVARQAHNLTPETS